MFEQILHGYELTFNQYQQKLRQKLPFGPALVYQRDTTSFDNYVRVDVTPSKKPEATGGAAHIITACFDGEVKPPVICYHKEEAYRQVEDILKQNRLRTLFHGSPLY